LEDGAVNPAHPFYSAHVLYYGLCSGVGWCEKAALFGVILLLGGSLMETDERYEVIEEAHGEGGFGRISKNRDGLLDRLVAVKQLKLLDEEARERFRREA
jgi:hypothetical protein